MDKVGPACQPPSRRPRVDLSMLTWISEDVFGHLRFHPPKTYFPKCAFGFSVKDPLVMIFIAKRSLAEKLSYLFTRSSK